MAVWKQATQYADEVYEKFLIGTEGMWLGGVEGHHFYEFEGEHTDQILFEKLRGKFLGTSAYINIPEFDFTLWIHHGEGGSGVLPGGGLNKLYHTSAGLQRADVYLMGHNCLPTSARILTRRGFKNYDELIIGEDVLAYDIESRSNKWTPLKDVQTFRNAPMYRAKSRSFDVEATYMHQWVVRDWTNTEKLMPLEDTKINHDIVVAAMSEGGDSAVTPREAAIIGWLVTDGSIYWEGNSPNFQICQKKEPYKSEIRELLGDDGTEHINKNHEGCSYFYIRASFVRRLAELGFSSRKDLSVLIPQLSVESRASMLDAFIKAEGDGVFTFSQQLGPVWDAFLMLTALQGIRCGPAIKATELSPVWINGRKVIPTEFTYRKKILRKHQGPVSVAYLKVERINSNSVWCPTTKYGTWIAEFNGQVFITGNTKEASARLSRPYPVWGDRDSEHYLSHNDIHIINCGGFSKSNIVGHCVLCGRPRGDYAEQRMLTPSPLTGPIITVNKNLTYGRVRVAV